MSNRIGVFLLSPISSVFIGVIMNYLKIYNDLISSRKIFTSFSFNNYWEKHHIIARCMGGTDEPENLVLLTAKEHYVAHHLLMKAYPKNKKLAHAFTCMLWGQDKRRITSSQYNFLCDIRSQTRKGIKFSEEHIKNIGIASTGRKHSEETKNKVSKANKGKIRTEEHKENYSKAKKGIKFSEEHKEALSKAWETRENKSPNKGRIHTPEEIEKMKKAWEIRRANNIAKTT